MLGVTERGLRMVDGMGEVEDFRSCGLQTLTPILAPFLFLFAFLFPPLVERHSVLNMADLPVPFAILHLL